MTGDTPQKVYMVIFHRRSGNQYYGNFANRIFRCLLPQMLLPVESISTISRMLSTIHFHRIRKATSTELEERDALVIRVLQLHLSLRMNSVNLGLLSVLPRQAFNVRKFLL